MSVLYLRDYTSDQADRSLPPVVILHGLFGSGDNWGAVAKDLGLTRRCFALDLPGHGESPNENGELLDYHRMCRDLFDSHRHYLGGQVAVYLGHSMGGKAAMSFALHHSDLVAALIVVDIAPKRYERHHEDVLNALRAVDTQAISSRSEAEAAMAVHLKEPAMRGFLLKNLRPKTGEDGTPSAYEWRFDFASLDRDYEHIMDWPYVLGRLAPSEHKSEPSLPGRRFTSVQAQTTKTLWVKGGLSPYIDATADVADMAALFPQTELITIPGANHWVHVDQKNEFITQVRRFLL